MPKVTIINKVAIPKKKDEKTNQDSPKCGNCGTIERVGFHCTLGCICTICLRDFH